MIATAHPNAAHPNAAHRNVMPDQPVGSTTSHLFHLWSR